MVTPNWEWFPSGVVQGGGFSREINDIVFLSQQPSVNGLATSKTCTCLNAPCCPRRALKQLLVRDFLPTTWQASVHNLLLCLGVQVCLAVLNMPTNRTWVESFSRQLLRCLPALHAGDMAKALIAVAHLRMDVGRCYMM
jgi:hypothetical protein